MIWRLGESEVCDECEQEGLQLNDRHPHTDTSLVGRDSQTISAEHQTSELAAHPRAG